MWNLLKRYFMPIYTSPLDQFLQQFDESHPASASQLAEVKKHRALHQLRDQETPPASE